MSVNLQVNIGGLLMKNPVTVGSGTFGYGQEYDRYFDISRLGAVTVKSLSLKPRAGNPPPRLVETPAACSTPSACRMWASTSICLKKMPWLRERGCTIIANIYGHTPDEYAQLAERLEREGGADAIEANLSCPNVHNARDTGGCKLVAQSPERVAEYTRIVKSATKLPVFVKLSPNVMDITEPALAAQEAGADALSLINTLIGMGINPETRRPILSNVVGRAERPGHPARRSEDGVGRRARS